MRPRFILAVASLLTLLAGCSAPQTRIERDLGSGERRVAGYFGERFLREYQVRLFDDRQAFADWTEGRFGFRADACWMVALGVGDTLALLRPETWREQACEHDPDDERHVRRIIAHELVHVFHGQHQADPDFNGMDEYGWFLEGLAVYVSGQYDAARAAQAREAIARGEIPDALQRVWSGQARYALAGSLVAYIEQRYGRKTIVSLLPVNSTTEALSRLGLSERELLDAWTNWLRGY